MGQMATTIATSPAGWEDDPDDPMTVTDIPCTICGSEIDVNGTCANGHDDLDRADAHQPVSHAQH